MVVRCEFLKKCAFLDPLSNELVGKLAGALEQCIFDPEEYIIRQGEMGNNFFIIEEGQVKCTQIKSSGREVELMYVPVISLLRYILACFSSMAYMLIYLTSAP